MKDPFLQFSQWLERARRTRGLKLSEAMCLSTVGPSGHPEGRMVLLKDFDRRGFVFYTNLGSRKARSLRAKPVASLTFHWAKLGRQVSISGSVKPTSTREADAYFQSRPRLSQIAAWASQQSAPLSDRKELERRFQEFQKKFRGQKVPRPPFWSGFRVIPHMIEFWEERPNRLHDRFLFTKKGKKWSIQRLYP